MEWFNEKINVEVDEAICADPRLEISGKGFFIAITRDDIKRNREAYDAIAHFIDAMQIDIDTQPLVGEERRRGRED